MYNRYVPQSDGTYRRNRIPDSPPRRTAPEAPKEPPCQTEEPAPVPCNPATCPQRGPMPPRRPKPRPVRSPDTSATGFLKGLLPKNLDTGDLLVILLLLLMSGDCADDQNTALLTLALYLFL